MAKSTTVVAVFYNVITREIMRKIFSTKTITRARALTTTSFRRYLPDGFDVLHFSWSTN